MLISKTGNTCMHNVKDVCNLLTMIPIGALPPTFTARAWISTSSVYVRRVGSIVSVELERGVEY